MHNAKLEEMLSGIERWLEQHDYNYIECNNVPEHLFVKNKKVNVLLRTFFRLCPVNLRNMKLEEGQGYPLTPQAHVALLKAFSLAKNKKVLQKLYARTLSLRSPMARNFALRQGIKIAINLYEDSENDPTPLNTVWFGQFLLDDETGIVTSEERKALLLSICKYLVEELGYIDYKGIGVYFRYGHHLTRTVYNASAIISAFLLKVGSEYGIAEYVELGRRGIRYICSVQNEDGSWFYAAKPERQTIDCFHQSYIMQAICEARPLLDFDVEDVTARGAGFYMTMFADRGKYLVPRRYDKRFTPHNTWLFVKTDGRDIAEALVFFSKYYPQPELVEKLLNYAYDKFYNKPKGYMYPEQFVYGMNRIPYIEFQAWFLYAFNVVKTRQL